MSVSSGSRSSGFRTIVGVVQWMKVFGFDASQCAVSLSRSLVYAYVCDVFVVVLYCDVEGVEDAGQDGFGVFCPVDAVWRECHF